MAKLCSLPLAALLLLFLTPGVHAKKPKQHSAPLASVADFFPLRVGDSWKYRNTSGDAEYTLNILSEEPQADGSTRCTMEKMAGVRILYSFSKPPGWVLLHSEGYPEHEGLEARYEPAKQYLPNPAKVGFQWTSSSKDPAQTEVTEKSKVVGFENVTVPAGKFRAIKVVSEVTGGVAHMTKSYWYADGVGLVKTTTDGGKIKYGFELTDYSFRKDKKR
ncbi:MAG: hypothetical protein M3N12_03645 [Verrucomicrobiota bacterium]|nr:hypothetical protein [Verrucomicrobiota bacterium]